MFVNEREEAGRKDESIYHVDKRKKDVNMN